MKKLFANKIKILVAVLLIVIIISISLLSYGIGYYKGEESANYWQGIAYQLEDDLAYQRNIPPVIYSPPDIPETIVRIDYKNIGVPEGLPENILITTVTNTGSMKPTLTYGMAVYLEPVKDVSILKAGDIIYYKYRELNILHRIVEIGSDECGWFCQTKGDNSSIVDNNKVRESDVLYLYRGSIN